MAERTAGAGPVVGLIMGSGSDWKTMRCTAERLEALGIACDRQVVSAHRTPDDLFAYAEQAEARGLSLIIAAAGGAAHLPGMTASKTIVPVLGVPVVATPLRGIDALLSILQMPAEIGVATLGVGARGADQAALFAATILSREDAALRAKLRDHRDDLLAGVEAVPGGGAPGPKASILMEREADFEVMEHTAKQFGGLGIPHSLRYVGPNPPPEELLQATREESAAGAAVFIAGSANGIDLACRAARTTLYPVLGVPLISGEVESIDRFVQPLLELPSGVAAFAVGRPGAINAALFAAAILSGPESEARRSLRQRRADQAQRVREMRI